MSVRERLIRHIPIRLSNGNIFKLTHPFFRNAEYIGIRNDVIEIARVLSDEHLETGALGSHKEVTESLDTREHLGTALIALWQVHNKHDFDNNRN